MQNPDRLDLLRGFSGAEKLTYPEEVREFVRDHGSRAFHSFIGCPPVIFSRIGQVLQAGKGFLAGTLSLTDFQQILRSAENFFRGWDPEQATYPTEDPEWGQLAEAFRHACLLRILRFPDAFAVSCNDPTIQTSVSAILDVCAKMPRDSVFYKRLLFPVFLAGADTSSPHQMHYAGWCVNEIKHSTKFQHPAMTDMLTRVWEQRQNSGSGMMNVPWMEFTCSEQLESQHAYLFF
ncbi:uncharacterized protein DNG_09446 [Cephalotrichum gorgonifer]|uniref:Uncharacterized protein n=1 Tax=Cephalotrichum gorgonifer TaxID=2041049 RepID=A0AAE8T048_9PEZI|nr:uncharacterized protein DNG_09446 [Cephalotrichum gorgonifer]